MFHNLTKNSQTQYELNTPGKQIFFLLNRSGNFEFTLATPGIEAYIFALFVGKDAEEYVLNIKQIHQAPSTVSHTHVRYLGYDASRFRYQGLIKIEKEAQKSKASQENRNLLLSENAQVSTLPELEILADDVTCRHAAATAKLNDDMLFYATSRGISQEEAEQMFAEGFIEEFFRKIEAWGKFEELEKYQKESGIMNQESGKICTRLDS